MDCSLPGSSTHGIFQARILEWVAIASFRRSSWPRDWTWVSHIVGRCFTIRATREVRPLRYDLNQILYNYTVEVTNRFKALGLIDRVSEELWLEFHDIIQEVVIKTIPKKKKCKTLKQLSEKALQIAVKRREMKGKGEKERCTHLNAEFQTIARRDKKAFLSDQCKEIEEHNRMGKILQENWRYQGNISCQEGHNKRQKWYRLNRSRRY